MNCNIQIMENSTVDVRAQLKALRDSTSSNNVRRRNLAKGHYQELLREINFTAKRRCEDIIMSSILAKRFQAQPSQSQLLIRSAVILSPRNMECNMEAVKNLYLQEKYTLAIRALDQVFVHWGPSWKCLHIRGICLIRAGLIDEAIETFKAAWTICQHRETSHQLLALFILASRYQEACDLLQSSMEKHFFDTDSRIVLGYLAEKLNASTASFSHFCTTLLRQNSLREAVLGIGRFYQRCGESAVAISKYRIIAADHLNAAFWNDVGVAFLDQRNYNAAISCISKARRLDPWAGNISFNLGIALLSGKCSAAAFVHLECSSRLHSENATLVLPWLAAASNECEDGDNSIDSGMSELMASSSTLGFSQLFNICLIRAQSGKLDEARALADDLKRAYDLSGLSDSQEKNFATLWSILDL
eukprot:Partr_v1_DN28768_c1_g1_i1_m61800 putative Bardet-biedl syndrome 4